MVIVRLGEEYRPQRECRDGEGDDEQPVVLNAGHGCPRVVGSVAGRAVGRVVGKAVVTPRPPAARCRRYWADATCCCNSISFWRDACDSCSAMSTAVTSARPLR